MTIDEAKLRDGLRSWSTLNARLRTWTEVEVARALELELASDRREAVLDRLYARVNRLRARRERRALLLDHRPPAELRRLAGRAS